MKTVKHLLFLVLSISPILSCDELEEFLEQEIEIQTSFTRILSIESPMTSNPDEAVSFESAFATYNFETDPEVAELIANPSEITKIRITEVRYLFQDVVGNTNANVEGDFEVITGPTGSTQRFESVVTHLATADENNRLFFLEGNFTNVNNFITEFHSIGFRYLGSVSDNPVDFKVDVTIFVTVTIKPDLDL